MPVCPGCKTEQTRRVAGRCPSCGLPIEAHKGFWYRTEIGSPTQAVLQHFEGWVSKVLSKGRQTPVIFSVPRKSSRYKRELVAAERLLRHTDGDFDLVIETIDLLFTDRRFSKSRNTLLWLESDFLTALAVAQANRESRGKKEELENKAYDAVMNREQLF